LEWQCSERVFVVSTGLSTGLGSTSERRKEGRAAYGLQEEKRRGERWEWRVGIVEYDSGLARTGAWCETRERGGLRALIL